MAELPNVLLNLSNRPENVLLVREVLTGVAEAVELVGNELNDIRTAVTEACNNVVLHAYEGGEGPLEIEVYTAPSAIEVVVRDHGTGIRPRSPASEDSAYGLGLPVIQALVDRVEFKGAMDSGTEVRMAFATPGARALEPSPAGQVDLHGAMQAQLDTAVALIITPTRLARTILPRVLSALAARAHFSTDRISDVQLVADALAAQAPRSISGRHLGISLGGGGGQLELRVAPLRAGSARQLIVDSAVEGLGQVIVKLVDDHRVASVGADEILAVQIKGRR